jgi:C4-dicarboxylate-specific signal transduction histidine kinase
VFPTHSEADNDVVRKTILTGVHQSKEYFESTLNGLDVEVVLWDMYPVNGDLGMTSVIGIGRSVSDEKRLQAQMLHQEKMASFGLLAAGVAHEIGNPLAAIKSQLHRVSNDPKSAPVTETFDVVNSEVGRIGRLLRDLIDFSRRPRDRVVLLSINQVIRDVTRLLEHDPRSRNVPVELELAEGLPGIRGREDGLFQVLLNLGLNALDAMPDGGHLKVLSRLANDEVVVKVSDCGSGIPQELWQRVFEPFFTTKDPERGTGLGLFVSRAIAADFGGRLSLEKSDAKGTTFAIHIAVQGPAPKERMS